MGVIVGWRLYQYVNGWILVKVVLCWCRRLFRHFFLQIRRNFGASPSRYQQQEVCRHLWFTIVIGIVIHCSTQPSNERIDTKHNLDAVHENIRRDTPLSGSHLDTCCWSSQVRKKQCCKWQYKCDLIASIHLENLCAPTCPLSFSRGNEMGHRMCRVSNARI